MTEQELKRAIRKIESAHMAPAARYFYKGRFMVCVKCQCRFRQRPNGTLHLIGTPNVEVCE